MKTNRTKLKKDHLLIVPLDLSGSMANNGKKEAAYAGLNAARDAILEKRDEFEFNAKMQVITFNSKATPMFASAVDLEDCYIKEEEPSGMTNFGDALDLLDKQLSSSCLFKEDAGSDTHVGYLEPTIIFVSDGYSTQDYTSQLAKLKTNKWFNAASKIAIAIGRDADKQMLAECTGSPDTVIEVDRVSDIKNIISFATIGTAMMKEATHLDPNDVSKSTAEKINREVVNSGTPEDMVEVIIYDDKDNKDDDSNDKFSFDNSGKWTQEPMD